MSLARDLVSATMLAQTLRMAVPYACAALGGVWSERSGVVNIALEGMLLASGLAAVAAHVATSSATAGVIAAIVAGAALASAHGALFVWGRVDAIVSGVALNMVAAGGTRFLLRALYDSSSNSPAVAGFRIAALDGASGPLLLARTLLDPLSIATALLTALTVWSMYSTRFGLRVRAAGENPDAAQSAGVPVNRVRVIALALGGAICGVGGAALAYDQHQFASGMSGGRGFIALAAVIVSGWRPARAVAACVLFAALDALQIVAQDQAVIPRDIVQMLPYAATLLALVVIAARKARSHGGAASAGPAGIGRHPSV